MTKEKKEGEDGEKRKMGKGRGKMKEGNAERRNHIKRVTASKRLVITLKIILKASEVLNFRVIANCTELQLYIVIYTICI